MVAFNQGSTSLQSIVQWIPTDLTGSDYNNSVLIRKGDSLLLMASSTSTGLSIDANGDGVDDFTGSGPALFAYAYNTPGIFVARAKVNGVSIGSLLVNVVDIDLHCPLAAEIGFDRITDIGVLPFSLTPDVFFVPGSAQALSVIPHGTFTNTQSSGAELDLLALRGGTSVLVARLGNASGPIL